MRRIIFVEHDFVLEVLGAGVVDESSPTGAVIGFARRQGFKSSSAMPVRTIEGLCHNFTQNDKADFIVLGPVAETVSAFRRQFPRSVLSCTACCVHLEIL